MMPPFMTVGSRPPASSIAATREVVVVLPWVPPTATDHLSRINSPSISARRTIGANRSRAATTSGLSGLTAEEITTTWAWSTLAGACPIVTVMPSPRRRRTLAFSAMSLPCTS
jgi:hypothetical protein